MTVSQANERSRQIQKNKTGDIQANGSKQDRARLKQIYQELGGNPFDEELKTIQAQRTALKNKTRITRKFRS